MVQLFTISDALNALQLGFGTTGELKGILSGQIIKIILLPFHEFSITAALVAAVWARILWKNKGLLFSGVVHMLYIHEWVMSETVWFTRQFKK